MSGRKKKKVKYKLRLDRVGILLVVILSLIVLIVFFFKSCSNNADTTPDSDTSAVQQGGSSLASFSAYETAIERLGFKKITVPKSQVYSGALILVNSEHGYVASDEQVSGEVSVQSNKNDSYNVINSTLMLQGETVKYLNAMMQDYSTKNSDNSFMITSGYRTMAEQEILYEQTTYNDYAENKAGFSENHTGYGFDMCAYPTDATKQSFSEYVNSSWILSNCANYGFIQRYPEDKKNTTNISNPSHFRYVGVPHSNYITEKGICLEEYISMLNSYKFGVKSLRYSCGDKNYMVYICDAGDTDNIEVYVPANKNYTLSGNNLNSIIVTVEL